MIVYIFLSFYNKSVIFRSFDYYTTIFIIVLKKRKYFIVVVYVCLSFYKQYTSAIYTVLNINIKIYIIYILILAGGFIISSVL